MNSTLQIVPFDGIWGSFARYLEAGHSLPEGPRSALDLGSGPGYPLWTLYHEYGFDALTGIDTLSESVMLAHEKRHLPRENRTQAQELLWNCSSLYELYRLVIRPENSEAHKQPLQPMEFYQHFNFRWECGIQDFLDAETKTKEETETEASQYHVIILSNILHFFPHEAARKIIAQATQLLAPGGTLWIRTYHKDSIRFQDGRFYKAAHTQAGEYRFRANQGSYYAYDEKGFLNLFPPSSIKLFEGVKNPSGNGLRFLTAIIQKN